MRRLAWLWVLLVAAAPAPLFPQAQPPGSARLAFTTTSPLARDAIAAAWEDFDHGYPQRARLRARNALTIDAGLGVARVLAARLATDISEGQRNEELNRGVADAARGSTAELVIAATLRASALGRSSEAQALADAALALMPDDPSIALLRATLPPVTPAGRLPALLEITRKFPTFAPAFNLAARGQLAAGDTAAALHTIEEYVRLAPDHPSAHGAYAEILSSAGRPREALSHYRRAVEIEPAFATGYAGIAAVNMAMKQYAEAITIMRRALALEPAMMSGYNLIAQAHLYLGDPAQARSVFLQGGERAPTPAIRITQQNYAALTFVVAGNPKDAIQGLMDVATSAEQQDLRAQAAAMHRNMALLEATLGERRLVAGHLARAAQLSPQPANAPPLGAPLRFAALCYALTGQLDQARGAAKQFGDVAAAGMAVQRNNWHEVNAVLAIAERNLDRARSELEEAGPALLGRALFAEALRNAGRTVESRAVRDDLLSRPLGPTVFDVISRFKMQRM